MLYLEMSRDAVHGGGTWAFKNCIWAPTRKENGATWPFWSKVSDVRRGDQILHLRGVPPHAAFVGFSTASSHGYETSSRPPDPKGWDFAATFFRADLNDYVEFERPVNLTAVFSDRRDQLEAYFDRNKRSMGRTARNIFFVRQSGRLQCLNGAYLSDVDDDLLSALFDEPLSPANVPSRPVMTTASGLALLRTRIGQRSFSNGVRKACGNRCCCPDCPVDDLSF